MVSRLPLQNQLIYTYNAFLLLSFLLLSIKLNENVNL